MAKNPLYNTAVYFSSDRYDDAVVNDFLYGAMERSYERCLQAQTSVAMRKEFHGTMDQFVIDVALNTKYNLAPDSYTYSIPSAILPIVDKKRFIQRYKNYQKHIPLLDIATDTKTFHKRFLFSTDSYLYMKLELLETNDRHTILIIHPGVNGIEPPLLNDLRDNKKPWCLWSEGQSKIYYTNSLANTILNSTYDAITIPSNSLLAPLLERKTDVNAWDIAASLTRTVGRQMLAVGSARFLQSTPDSIQFAIDSEFGHMIGDLNSALDVYLIHQPDRISKVIYRNQPDTSPIISLPGTTNPQFACMGVYEYDIAHHMRKRRLDETKGTIYYPNVFDFSTLIADNTDLLVEVTEYPSTDTGSQFQCPISSYLSATAQFYPSIITSSSCPAPLKNYVPQKLILDYEDYATSEYVGDFRGYKLDKLKILQKDNPYINYALTRMLDEKSRRFYTENGSPSFFKFGSPYVTDTSFISVLQPDEILYFPEPQGYVTIKANTELPMVFYYLNGAWTLPYHVESQMDLTYAFLPKTTMEEVEQVYTDAGLTPSQFNDGSAMTVDYFTESTSASSQAIYSTVWNQLGEPQSLFDDYDAITEYSLSDLILYNLTTGEYYDKDKQFSVSLELDEYRVKNDFVDEVILLDRHTTMEFLLTSLSEIYATKDSQPIVLKVGSTVVPMDPLLESLPNGLSDIDGKKLSKETIQIAIKDPSLLGVSVGVALGTRGTTSRVSGSDLIQNNWEAVSENFIGVPNANRMEVYLGGTLLMEGESYTLELPTRVGGDLRVRLTKDYFTNQGLTDEKVSEMDLYINYLPLEMNVVTIRSDTLFEANFLDSTLTAPDKWEKSNFLIGTFLDGTDAAEVLVKESTRVFCGGVRIPNFLLLDVYAGNTMNIIPVAEALYGPTSFVRLKRFGEIVESNDLLTNYPLLTVKYQKRDLDLYDIHVKDPIENQLLDDAMRKKNPKTLRIHTNPGAYLTATNGRVTVTKLVPNNQMDLVYTELDVPYNGTWTLSIRGYDQSLDVVVTKDAISPIPVDFYAPARKLTLLYTGPDGVKLNVNGTLYAYSSTAYGVSSEQIDLYTMNGDLSGTLDGGGAAASIALNETDRSDVSLDLTWIRNLSLILTANASYTVDYLGNEETAGTSLFQNRIQSTDGTYSYAIKVFGWWKFEATGISVTKKISIDNVTEPIEALIRIEKTVTITANQNRDITITKNTTPITTIHSPASTDGTPTTLEWKTYDAGDYVITDGLTSSTITLGIEDTSATANISRKIDLPLLANGGIDVVMTDPFGTATTITLPITKANPDGKPETTNISVWHNAGTYTFETTSRYDTSNKLSTSMTVVANSTTVNAGLGINFYCIRGYSGDFSQAYSYRVDGPGGVYYDESYFDEHGMGIPGKVKKSSTWLYREGDYSFSLYPGHNRHSVHITFRDITSELLWID